MHYLLDFCILDSSSDLCAGELMMMMMMMMKVVMLIRRCCDCDSRDVLLPQQTFPVCTGPVKWSPSLLRWILARVGSALIVSMHWWDSSFSVWSSIFMSSSVFVSRVQIAAVLLNFVSTHESFLLFQCFNVVELVSKTEPSMQQSSKFKLASITDIFVIFMFFLNTRICTYTVSVHTIVDIRTCTHIHSLHWTPFHELVLWVIVSSSIYDTFVVQKLLKVSSLSDPFATINSVISILDIHFCRCYILNMLDLSVGEYNLSYM